MTSCNENDQDSECQCETLHINGENVTTKIYDNEKESYLCCGSLPYDMYKASKSHKTYLQAAINSDKSPCKNWWKTFSSLNEDRLQNQVLISKYFTKPKIKTVDDKVIYSCHNDKKIKVISYKNPNNKGYLEAIKCVPNDLSSNKYNDFNQMSDFAVFNIANCTNKCDISNMKSLSLELSSKSEKYTGPTKICETKKPINIALILFIITSILIVITVIYLLYYKYTEIKKTLFSVPAYYYTTDSIIPNIYAPILTNVVKPELNFQTLSNQQLDNILNY
jgi:hypothetical protein